MSRWEGIPVFPETLRVYDMIFHECAEDRHTHCPGWCANDLYGSVCCCKCHANEPKPLRLGV